MHVSYCKYQKSSGTISYPMQNLIDSLTGVQMYLVVCLDLNTTSCSRRYNGDERNENEETQLEGEVPGTTCSINDRVIE